MTRHVSAAMVVLMVGCGGEAPEETAESTQALRALPDEPPEVPEVPEVPAKPAKPPVVVYLAPAVPPPLGPPAPRDPIRDMGVQAILTAVLKGKVDETVAAVNARNAMNTDVRAKISWSFTVFGPSLTATQYTDRPNERFVNVPYMIDYRVYDIEKHTAFGWVSVPATRHISQTIDLQMFCNQWQTNLGRLKLVARAQPLYLENDQGTLEQVVNFFVANTLTSYIDSQVRSRLSGIQAGSGIDAVEFPAQCDALGASSGLPSDLGDDVITWSHHPRRITLPTVYNQLSVTLTSVRRLVAHDRWGGVLYDAVETPAVEMYANHQHIYLQLPAMVEGQQVAVNAPTMVMDRPARTESLVVIGNVILPTPSASRTESAFRVFGSSMNFGNGTQSMVVQKSYWEKFDPRTGAKPYEVLVNGYELVFQVNAPQPVVAQSFTAL